MKFEITINNNMFIVWSEKKIIETIPAYIIQLDEEEFLFGKEAYEAIDIMPNLVYRLDELVVLGLKNMQISMFMKLKEFLCDKYSNIPNLTQEFKIILKGYKSERIEDIIDYVFERKEGIGIEDIIKKEYRLDDVKLKIHDYMGIVVSDTSYFLNGEIYCCLIDEISNSIIHKNYKDLKGSHKNKLKRVLTKRVPFILHKLEKEQRLEIEERIVTRNFEVERFKLSIKRDDISNSEIYKNAIKVAKGDNELKNMILFNKSEDFKVGFISPFTFGKSTLINSFLYDEILKADIRAETAVITKVICSNFKKVLIKYSHGKILDFNYEDNDELKEILGKYTGVRGESDSIEEIKIFYEHEDFNNITFIDAPGLFSMHDGHNELAERALKESDLVLFAIEPSRVGDINFTKKIEKYVEYLNKNNTQFAFVLTKMDLYNDEKIKIMKEMEIVLNELKLTHIPYYCISGYWALRARQAINEVIEHIDLQLDRSIYVFEEKFRVMGRQLKESHYEKLLESSGISELEEYIMDRKEEWQ